MIRTQYINLDMTPSGVLPVLYCSQYDIGRPLGMVVYNGGEAVDLSTYTCTIEATRSDGTAIAAAVTADGNIGVFVTTATMTNQKDRYPAKMVIVDSAGNRVASLAFVMCVTPATMDENAEGIEEDKTLYQQYAGTVQILISAIKNDLLTETNRAKAAEATLQENIDSEASARAVAITAEASARQAADNALQANINQEAAIRATQDTSLQSQINQLVAPSGDAPSMAEVQNARIGVDGTTYDTLGDAIRGQVTDSEIAIEDTVGFIRDNLIKNVTSYKNLNGDTKNVYLSGCTATAGNDVITIKATSTSVRFGTSGNTSNNYNVTGYGYPIRCQGVGKLRFILSNPACNVNYVSFWKSDGTYISTVNRDSTDFVVDIPSNAYICAIRVDIRNATVGAEYPLTIKVFSYLENSMSEQIEQKTGEIDSGLGRFMSDYNDYFELGNITIGTSSWAYANSTSRVRTLSGLGIRAYVGDVIALSDYSNARFYVGWRTLDGIFGSRGWNTSDFTVEVEGYYCILIANLSDTTQTDKTALASLFRYYKKAHKRVDYAVSDIDKISDVSYETFPGYITAGGIIGAPGEDGEVYTSYIPCNNGDTVKYYLSSGSQVKHWLSCAVYDSGKTFIRRITVANYNQLQRIIDGEFTISDTTAAFIRLTYRSFTDVDAHFYSPSHLPLSVADINSALEGIESAIKSDVVPSYFESDLDSKIPEIIANMNDAGQNGTSFVFITDLHWESNYRNSPALVKRILNKTSVKNVFCGGDIINQGEKAEMAEIFLDCINHFRFVPNLGFFPIARGNHDDNSNWSASEDITTYEFDANTVYNLLYSQIAENVTRLSSEWDFYFDQSALKTRYVFVDTKRNGNVIDIAAILDCLESVQSGWHVIFVMHFGLVDSTTLFAGCDVLAHIVKAYNDRASGSYTGTYQSVTYNFTGAAGKIDLIMCGHMHADYAMPASDENNPAGVPIIATDTDSYRTTTSIEGTVDSQCFDVVTVNYSAKTVKCVRIGRGSNRAFSY